MLSEKRLLFSVRIEDCKVQTFTVQGPGGGGKDTSNTGVRVQHPPSGAAGVGTRHRSQHKNKLEAFKRMREDLKFRAWHKKVTAELMTGKTVEEAVNDAMTPDNLKVEVRTPKGWEDIKTHFDNCEQCSKGDLCPTGNTLADIQ